MVAKLIYTDGQKTCTLCKETKLLSEFGIRKDRNNQPTSKCRVCASSKSLAWNRNNRDKFLINCQNYYSKNRERILSKIDWKARKEYDSIYKPANRDKDAVRSAERRAIKKLSEKAVDRTGIDEVFKRCMEVSNSTKIKHHVDHVVPLKSKFVCGLHCVRNLQVIPASENLRKLNTVWPDMPDTRDKSLLKLARDFYAKTCK